MTTELTCTYNHIAATDGDTPPVRFLLLKDGDCDWVGLDMALNQEAATRLIDAFKKHGSQIPIDYHHASLRADSRDGTKAPAAGWIRDLEYVPAEGLYAKDVEWTEQASKEIVSKQYKYQSPVVMKDDATGDMHHLHSVALTNTPRTRGLRELLEAASLVANGVNEMSEKKKTDAKLSAVAGQEEMLEEAPSMSITPEQEATIKLKMVLMEKGATLDENASVADIMNAAIDALGGDAAEGEEGDGEAMAEEAASLVAASLGSDSKDLKVMCAEISKLKAAGSQYKPVAAELADLKAQFSVIAADRAAADAEERVQVYVNAGTILPDDETAMAAARTLSAQNADTFEMVYASMPVVCPPGRTVVLGAGGSDSARAKCIADSHKEFKADPQVGHKADRAKHYVAADLSEAGFTPLTAAEVTKLEGGE